MFKIIMDKKGFYVVSPFIGVIFILIVITMAAFIVNENMQQLELSKAGFGGEMIFLGQVLVADAFDVYIQNKIQTILNEGVYKISGPDNPDCEDCIDVRAKAAFDSRVGNLYALTFDMFDLECTPEHSIFTSKVLIPLAHFTVPVGYNPGVEEPRNRFFYYIYDGVGDECDSCPDDRFNDIDGDGICDGEEFNPPMVGANDNCPYAHNPSSQNDDSDNDGLGDACDPDAPALDNDGIINFLDNCPEDDNPNQADSDHDAIGDDCDPCPDDRFNDIDGDGICDGTEFNPDMMDGAYDNCPGSFELDLTGDITTFNPDQEDCDGDGNVEGGNACDSSYDRWPECYDQGSPTFDISIPWSGDIKEADGDGIPDHIDNCMNDANPDQQDVDDGNCFIELTIIPKDYKLHCTSKEALGEFYITFTGRKYLLVGTTICCTDDPGGTEDICGLRDRELLNCP